MHLPLTHASGGPSCQHPPYCRLRTTCLRPPRFICESSYPKGMELGGGEGVVGVEPHSGTQAPVRRDSRPLSCPTVCSEDAPATAGTQPEPAPLGTMPWGLPSLMPHHHRVTCTPALPWRPPAPGHLLPGSHGRRPGSPHPADPLTGRLRGQRTLATWEAEAAQSTRRPGWGGSSPRRPQAQP